MEFFLTLIVFVFIISFLIFSHELGHFIAAKKSGLLVEEFALGFPPRIFSKKVGETLYSLNSIPIGGFVKIYGEDGEKEVGEDKRSFSNQRPLTKAKVLVAGVFANIILAVFIFYLVLLLSGFKWTVSLPFDYNFIFGSETKSPLVGLVLEESPAEKAGIKEQDLILTVNGKTVSTRKEFTNYISSGEEAVLSVKNINSQEEREITLTPEKKDGNYIIGSMLVNISELKYDSFGSKIFSGFLHTANMTHLSFYSLVKVIGSSFEEKTVEPLRDSTAGIVGIFAIVNIVMTEGITELLNMIALISIGLAIVNILPVPALDGGRLVFVLYEAVFRKRAPDNFEKRLNYAGFIFIILLVIMITYNDVIRFGGIIKEMF